MPTMLENGDPVELDEDDTTTVECYDCGDSVEQDTTTEIDGNDVCEDCAGNYALCDDCEEFVNSHDLNSVEDGDKSVCDSCSYDYSTCDSCSTSVHNDSTIGVGYDGTCCQSCYENGYAQYCDYCGEYYWEHDGSCCSYDCDCEAPRQQFLVPSNGGNDTVQQDERVTVTLESGIIDDAGLAKISDLIRMEGSRLYREMREAVEAEGKLVYDLPPDHEIWAVRSAWSLLASEVLDSDAIGNEWQGQRGNYTRRLRRHAYNEYKIALPDALITEVGNVARAQSQGSEYAVEFTRDLNQSADDFYHSESCWWTDYSEGRCSLKSNGGFGMRTFGERKQPRYGYQYGPWRYEFGRGYVHIDDVVVGEVTGRAWVMPVVKGENRWEPTFDSTTPDGYIVFNGYGDLSNYAPARILAEMTGLTYLKIGFENSPMYVNAGGYLVTTKERIDEMKAVTSHPHITLYTETHSNLHQKEMTANVAA